MKAALLICVTLGCVLLPANPSGPRDVRSAFAQTSQTPAAAQTCPNITIECPDIVQRTGISANFSAKVSGAA